MLVVQAVGGLLLMVGLCYLCSERRGDVRWMMVAKSLALQLAFALLLLKLPVSQQVFLLLNKAIGVLVEASRQGTTFIFGYLGGGDLPFQESGPGTALVLAFQTMPMVIVFSALAAILMYWGVLPLLMRGLSIILRRSLEIGGAQGLGVAANAFVGMVESPLFVRPYLKQLSRGELFSIMVAGMATVAGTVLALYAAILSELVPNAIGHLISCSIITLPAAVYVGHLLVPHQGKVTSGELAPDGGADSFMDAVSKGTANGVQLFINIVSMIIVMVALVAIVNAVLGLAPPILFGEPLSLEGLLGLLMMPLTMMMGVPWHEAWETGKLMGLKMALTEFIAYVEFGKLPVEALSERTRVIMAYALCGFANFVSLGIMVTGLVTMVPERRDEILALGLKAVLAGTLATCTSATVVGIIY